MQLNPAFAHAENVAELARDKVVHTDVADIFKGYSLYQHQLEALKLGVDGNDFIVTSPLGKLTEDEVLKINQICQIINEESNKDSPKIEKGDNYVRATAPFAKS